MSELNPRSTLFISLYRKEHLMGFRVARNGIRVQIDADEEDRSRSVRYGLPNPNFAQDVVSESFSIIQFLADAVEKQLVQTNATEAEITFGLKLSIDGELYISNTPDKGNYIVRLKWDQERSSNIG